jgi:hypothetical protein
MADVIFLILCLLDRKFNFTSEKLFFEPEKKFGTFNKKLKNPKIANFLTLRWLM